MGVILCCLDLSLASVILLCEQVCQSVVSVHVYVAWHARGRSTIDIDCNCREAFGDSGGVWADGGSTLFCCFDH
jgi:hypothetical protein